MADAQLQTVDETPKTSNFPLFFKRPVALDSKVHETAGLIEKGSFGFSKEARAVPISMYEIVDVARHYPIVFSPDEVSPLLLAVVSLKDTNLFVDENNSWEKYVYMPVYVRKYPFALIEDKVNDRFMLCVDEDADLYQAKDASRPFFDGENGTKLTNDALAMCGRFQKEMDQTREFAEGMAAMGMIAPKEIEMQISPDENDKPVRMMGFQLLDDAKLDAQSDDTIVEWHRKGWLPLMTMILASQRNWQYLAERQRKRQ